MRHAGILMSGVRAAIRGRNAGSHRHVFPADQRSSLILPRIRTCCGPDAAILGDLPFARAPSMPATQVTCGQSRHPFTDDIGNSVARS